MICALRENLYSTCKEAGLAEAQDIPLQGNAEQGMNKHAWLELPDQIDVTDVQKLLLVESKHCTVIDQITFV